MEDLLQNSKILEETRKDIISALIDKNAWKNDSTITSNNLIISKTPLINIPDKIKPVLTNDIAFQILSPTLTSQSSPPQFLRGIEIPADGKCKIYYYYSVAGTPRYDGTLQSVPQLIGNISVYQSKSDKTLILQTPTINIPYNKSPNFRTFPSSTEFYQVKRGNYIEGPCYSEEKDNGYNWKITILQEFIVEFYPTTY